MSEVITGDACPCCGDIALPRWCSVSRPNEQAPYGLESETRFYYECRKCGLRTKDYQTQKAALEAWNTRAERTCHVVPRIVKDDGEMTFVMFHCSEYERGSFGDVVGFIDEVGTAEEVIRKFKPHYNYCPNCGAKVVRS